MAGTNRLRSILAGACQAIGGLWAVAGVMRLVFGTAVTFPLLPPIDLARVHVLPAFAAAVGCFVVAGLIGRTARSQRAEDIGHADVSALPEPTPESPRLTRDDERVYQRARSLTKDR